MLSGVSTVAPQRCLFGTILLTLTKSWVSDRSPDGNGKHIRLLPSTCYSQVMDLCPRRSVVSTGSLDQAPCRISRRVQLTTWSGTITMDERL